MKKSITYVSMGALLVIGLIFTQSVIANPLY